MKRHTLLAVASILLCSANLFADILEHTDGQLTYLYYPSENTAYVSSVSNDASGAVNIPGSILIDGKPYTVVSIGMGAFKGCNGVTSVTISNGVSKIGNSAFYYCAGLSSVTIPNSVTRIGTAALSGCIALTSVTIPNSVTRIENYTFDNCINLTSITIPNSVTSIGKYAFYRCENLPSITIPNSVTSIGAGAFYNSNLTSVISEIKVPFAFGSEAFEDNSPNCVLYVPKGTRDVYIAAGWTEEVFMGGIVEMDGGDDIREKMDVNGDKEVSTADVTAIYSYIINGESSGFTRDKANTNGDNNVNTADVTAIYNYIINGK